MVEAGCSHRVAPAEDPADSLEIVEEAISSILATLDLPAVLERIADLLRRRFGVGRVSIRRLLPEDPHHAEVLLVSDPTGAGHRAGARVPLAGTAFGAAAESREPVALHDLDPERPRYREEEVLGEAGYGTLVCFPLLSGDRVLGTLDIAHREGGSVLCTCFAPVRRIARLVAIALENSLLVHEVTRLNAILNRENAYLKDQVRQSRETGRMVVESPAMRAVTERVRAVAPSETTVLVRGETGVGKEGVARLVHELSPRGAGPFVVVNVGAIPETLIESELFGHERGAFTGAVRRRAGKFEQADGGTLFLDEVGDAPLAVQVKLLRALQERVIYRLGGAAPIPVDVRVVAATNRDVEAMVESGEFRSDLYYRLNVFPVRVPPLRERREDVRPLAESLVARHAARMHRRPPRIPDEMIAALADREWPGNVRELENFLERALILSPGPVLCLPESPPESPPRRGPAGTGPRAFDDEVRDLLCRALARTEGRVYGDDGAARLLRLRPTTLQGKLRKHGIDPAAFRGRPQASPTVDISSTRVMD